MKVCILLLATCFVALSVAEDKCTAAVCDLSKNCRCSDAGNPLGANFKDYPQLIALTFDEAVTAHLVEKTWKPLLFSLDNPDKKPIGGTFYVPHEFTDYVKVNELFNAGFEIGVHSITKNNLQSYWRSANETLLEAEFKGQKIILNKFANIPSKKIRGVRTPQLQLNGDASIQAYVKSELDYDSSWPSLPAFPLFPYTLDYKSTQGCLLGAKCPTSSFKGFWVLPIIDLNGHNKECNALATCGVNGTAEEIATWLMKEVENIRETSRAPITLSINSYWFSFTENSFEGMQLFFKKAAAYKDIFFVAQSQIVDWIKKPIPTKSFKTADLENKAKCQAKQCVFEKTINMNSCTPCPEVYPWLNNPEGKRK